MPTTARKVDVQLFQGGKGTVQIDIPEKLGIMDDPAAKAPPHHGVIRIMTPKDGDKRVTWDSRDFSQIAEAKQMFDKCVSEGLVPYKVGVDGRSTSEVMSEFDPYAEEIIFLPIRAVVGG